MSDPKQPEYSGFLGMSGGPAPRAAALDDDALAVWKRASSGGIPDWKNLPLTPSDAMIEAGAQRLVRWETGKEVWPTSWDALDVRASLNDAEKVWRSMWLAAPAEVAEGPDALDTVEFYNLMQEYRHADPVMQSDVIARYDEIKTYIRAALRAAPSLPEEMPEWFEPILDADMTAKVIWSVLRAKVTGKS